MWIYDLSSPALEVALESFQTVYLQATVGWFFLLLCLFLRLIGMPKEKYDPPDPRRLYTIMSAEEAANGKKSHWAELEISGQMPFIIIWLISLCPL